MNKICCNRITIFIIIHNFVVTYENFVKKKKRKEKKLWSGCIFFFLKKNILLLKVATCIIRYSYYDHFRKKKLF